ncbi:hypothetical protein KJ815_08780 [bacterium]|nr:hypothetical protein [bacterium]
MTFPICHLSYLTLPAPAFRFSSLLLNFRYFQPFGISEFQIFIRVRQFVWSKNISTLGLLSAARTEFGFLREIPYIWEVGYYQAETIKNARLQQPPRIRPAADRFD